MSYTGVARWVDARGVRDGDGGYAAYMARGDDQLLGRDAGIVTLARAFALPARFPNRDLVVLTALCVVLGTLVVQGVTFRPLVTRMVLQDSAPVERERAQAREAGLRAALASLDAELAQYPTTDPVRARAIQAVRREYAEALGRGEVLHGGSGHLPGDALAGRFPLLNERRWGRFLGLTAPRDEKRSKPP